MFGLADIGAGLNLRNLDYHQSFVERHTKLLLKFSYLKDLDDADPLAISVVYRGKENEQGKEGYNLLQ